MYDPSPIRHIAVQCPDCERWFNGRDIGDQEFEYDNELCQTHFICPICGTVFSLDGYGKHQNVNVEECSNHNDVYRGIYQKVEKWEQL
jgi:hypothetical protein